MDIRKLQRAIVDGLEDVKAQHIAVFNTEHLSSMFERVIIATGTSNRQTKALAASVRDSVRGKGFPILSTEGEDNGEWIIVDCGAAVAHIMQPAIREYYNLEEIWGGKAVRLKVGAVQKGLVKASEPEPAAATTRKRATGARPGKAAETPEQAQAKAANRTAAAKRVATRSPARKAGASTRDSTAPATQTVVVKPKAAPKPAAKGAGKPASKPAARPAAKPAAKTASKSAPRPAAKAAGKTAPAKTAPRKTGAGQGAPRPAAVKTVARPAPARKAATKPATKPARKAPR